MNFVKTTKVFGSHVQEKQHFFSYMEDKFKP